MSVMRMMPIADTLEQLHGRIFWSKQRLTEIRMSREDYHELQIELIHSLQGSSNNMLIRARERFVTAYGSIDIYVDSSVPKDTAIFTSSYREEVGASLVIEAKKINLVSLENIEVRRKSARRIEIGEW